MFEHVHLEVLRLVDDEDGAATETVVGQQETVQGIRECLDAVARFRQLHVQFFADRRQEFRARQLGVQDDRHVGELGKLLEQGTDEGRLAGAHFAGELDEAAAFLDAVDEVRERLPVPLAQVEVAGIGGDREWLLVKAEEAGVHRISRGVRPSAF